MKKFLAILILLGLSLPIVIGAQQPTTPTLPTVDLLSTLEKIATLLFWILLTLAIVAIVWAGILFVTAGGKAEQVEQARHIILYAIVGIIIALLAYGIRSFLLSQIK